MSDATNPQKLGSYWDPTCSESVAIDGSYAYLAHGDQGLEVIDLSNPNELKVVEHFDAAGHSRGVAVDDNYAYLANGYTGIKILNVSNDEEVTTVGQLDTYRALDIEARDNLLYVADDWAGVKIIDTSSPDSPRVIGSSDTPGYAEGLELKDQFLYVDGESGVRTVDVSDSLTHEVAAINTPAMPTTRRQRQHFIVADGKGGCAFGYFQSV